MMTRYFYFYANHLFYCNGKQYKLLIWEISPTPRSYCFAYCFRSHVERRHVSQFCSRFDLTFLFAVHFQVCNKLSLVRQLAEKQFSYGNFACRRRYFGSKSRRINVTGYVNNGFIIREIHKRMIDFLISIRENCCVDVPHENRMRFRKDKRNHTVDYIRDALKWWKCGCWKHKSIFPLVLHISSIRWKFHLRNGVRRNNKKLAVETETATTKEHCID